MLAAVVAIYAIYLLVVGIRTTVYEELPAEQAHPGPPPLLEERYEPYPAAIFPLTAAIVLIGGLLTRRLLAIWIGFLFLLEFSALFVFSGGGILLPVSFILLLLLIAITIMSWKT